MIYKFFLDNSLKNITENFIDDSIYLNLKAQENDHTNEFYSLIFFFQEKELIYNKSQNIRNSILQFRDFFHNRIGKTHRLKKIKLLVTNCNAKYKQNWHRDESSKKVTRLIFPLKNIENSGIEFHNMPPVEYSDDFFYLVKQDIMHRTWCNKGLQNRIILVVDFYNLTKDFNSVIKIFLENFILSDSYT